MLPVSSAMSSEAEWRSATGLMRRFAERTGLTSNRTQRRYLWTDSFAVCNFLGFRDATGQREYLDLAVRTVSHVHHVLGRYRTDDRRVGWLSGLGGAEGEKHPTRGGLRIGKELPERRPNEPFDERLEWDRDGQYFHYLTQWMHALDRMTRATGDPTYNFWARELSQTAFRAFTYTPPGGHTRRMYWKMSVDLSRPLVPSMGKHDALDGYVTYLELSATASKFRSKTEGPDAGELAAELATMIDLGELATADPLGIGGLLIDALRADRLMRIGAVRGDRLLARLLEAALSGLEVYEADRETELPAERRLAFRELGLAIGLHAVERLKKLVTDGESPDLHASLDRLAHHLELAGSIERFWLDPVHQRASSWAEHLDINEVMLATSLAPQGYFGPVE